MNQVPLQFATPTEPGPAARAAIALQRDPAGFCRITERWLRENEHVWLAFYDAAEQLRAAGRSHYGAKGIMEVLRFNTALTDAEVTFKLNNNYTSGLARLYNTITQTDFFETRQAA
ncbi:hypothetical protein F3N42_03805 [Marinihelvus fidelis]|uniref:Uncharacterized protein n=1 Tax=Marinihelvus fidelis TaxID=2613842 RepID=A0A5N0THZ8_9GAMM|nr:hypothetical protein [Marinihelvus fidelis]KAA9133486.1 hypothetical protein F3N42_03805 [Marinihelvus fidelis]